MLEIAEREPLGTKVCVTYIPHDGLASLCSVSRIGQHGLLSWEACGRKVGSRIACNAATGYSLPSHAMEATEEKKRPPLGCHIRKLAPCFVTTACCATK